MSSELIISATENGGRIALLKEKNLIELHHDTGSAHFNVGDIYLGTVRKLAPSLNAAFIDIGYEKDAFLHYQDLGKNIQSLLKFVKLVQRGNSFKEDLSDFTMEPQIEKLGKIADVLKPNQRILVQVSKEPISTKGPRLGCELSLAGRYIVLVPFSDGVNVSRKITSAKERKRLLKLMSSIRPENFGIIIRTVAEGKEIAELERDLRELLDKWAGGVKTLVEAKPKQKVIGEMNRAASMLRDMFNESFDSVVVDNKEMFNEIKGYIHNFSPEKEHIVKLYTGKARIFENYGIEKQVKQLFGPSVNLPNGGYLIIEHTEALHVIDVNSGNKANSDQDQETTALNVNLEAATEIARQLRLRDMGGIVVIDFIDMKKMENKRKLYQHMKNLMSTERSKFTVLPISKFGLMQITRQRVRPEITISTQEKCTACNGTGKVAAAINVVDQIESNLEYILTKQNEKGISIFVHPYVFSFLTKGLLSKQVRWYFKYWKWVKLRQDSSLAVTQFHFQNKMGETIQI